MLDRPKQYEIRAVNALMRLHEGSITAALDQARTIAQTMASDQEAWESLQHMVFLEKMDMVKETNTGMGGDSLYNIREWKEMGHTLTAEDLYTANLVQEAHESIVQAAARVMLEAGLQHSIYVTQWGNGSTLWRSSTGTVIVDHELTLYLEENE